MTDIFKPDKRSDIMRKVKSAHTKPELLVRKFLHSKGLRFRLHDRRLPGTPDIKLSKYNALVFVNGCFWHGHGCRKCGIPKSNVGFWKAKISNNVSRDEKALSELETVGWKVFTVWECELKKKNLFATLENLHRSIVGELGEEIDLTNQA